MSAFGNFYRQLKRRGVTTAAIGYAAAAWALTEGASILTDAFAAPDVLMPVVVVLLALGFPAVMAFAWFFDITPDGIRRTEVVDLDDSVSPFDRRIGFVVISLLAAALLLSLYGNFREAPAPPQSISILIADFENAAGNELFSGVIEESLRVGLEVAPFVESYSRTRAASIASALGDDDSEALPLTVAGLVALRESINIVIGGSVRREGSGLVVTASGYAPGDQRELFRVTERGKSDAEILAVVAEVSEALRRELGDTEKPAGAGEAESFVVANLEAAAEYLKAQNFQFNRKLEEAVAHYEKAVELDPDFARAYAGLALTEEYLGRSQAAKAHWEKALSGLATLTERGQLRTLGNYYLISQQDYDQALETYERLVAKYPADNVAHNNLAVAAFYAMDFERALEVGREVAARFPEQSAYGANFALYAMYASSFDEAAAAAREVIAIDPANAYSNFVIAGTQAVAGNLDAARATYEQMAGFDQYARSVAAEGIADLALYRGDADAALQVLDAAIEAESAIGASTTVAIKHAMRADAYLLADEADNALQAADAALALEGNDPAVLVPVAMAYVELNEFARAEAVIDKLSDGVSRTRRAYAELLRALIANQQGDAGEALRAANAAVELADLWLTRLVRARVLFAVGQPEQARADVQVCEQRTGEGIAAFLNDRPSLRLLRVLAQTTG